MKLTPEAKKFYDEVRQEYSISDSAGLKILLVAAESLQMLRQAQDEVQKYGLTLEDKFGQRKPNPACQVMRDSRSQFLQSMKALRVDINPEEND